MGDVDRKMKVSKIALSVTSVGLYISSIALIWFLVVYLFKLNSAYSDFILLAEICFYLLSVIAIFHISVLFFSWKLVTTKFKSLTSAPLIVYVFSMLYFINKLGGSYT